ncbi:CoA ester lyase [Halosegnis rubeus]|jgi:citrate lyase subunit beta/citryl-CoA lyase|uniref:CoA ester lyase n=1 Tax=Halosegnis rubeus TaxID=2212850 RepID=A0A5N5UHS7_9EURY|nr:CoA ester lyase [Halosegnis rubeus]KAB7514929.1 CoA ester lyase [Halosegnis rubeus]KAB7518238.1 CoA ester lyase [Halosegnis rubeus]KAB7519182.1 CoA ester lyase [Halosegnis rubeus]
MARRSLLFSPADKPELLRKAPATNADTVCFDLEDAVAPSRKAAGRETVAAVLSDPEFDPDCEVCLRVNPDAETAAADLDALDAPARLDAVMVPKVAAPADVLAVTDLLSERGFDVPVIALCESAAGVLHAEAIAATDGVVALALGAEDLAADIGATRTPEGTEVSHARQQVVLAGAAAGVDVIDTIYTGIEDGDGLADETRFALELGYDGKMCIHPSQVGIVNDAFTPDGERIAWARRILEAATEATDAGAGVFRVDGEMVDAPLIAQAERVRERARASGVWGA